MDYSRMTGSDHGLPSFYQPAMGGNTTDPQQEELEQQQQLLLQQQQQQQQQMGGSGVATTGTPSRYEAQKRRDWNTFGQYLKNHRPPLTLARCSGAHVLEFLRYLDQFGKTKVHTPACPFFGHPQPPAPCTCPLRQAWGSLDALVGRLRAAFEENGGKPEANPFGARAVHLYLREVRQLQAKARGIAYDKKKRKRPSSKSQQQQQPEENNTTATSTTHTTSGSGSASTSAGGSMPRQHGYYAAMEMPSYEHILPTYGPPL